MYSLHKNPMSNGLSRFGNNFTSILLTYIFSSLLFLPIYTGMTHGDFSAVIVGVFFTTIAVCMFSISFMDYAMKILQEDYDSNSDLLSTEINRINVVKLEKHAESLYQSAWNSAISILLASTIAAVSLIWARYFHHEADASFVPMMEAIVMTGLVMVGLFAGVRPVYHGYKSTTAVLREVRAP